MDEGSCSCFISLYSTPYWSAYKTTGHYIRVNRQQRTGHIAEHSYSELSFEA